MKCLEKDRSKRYPSAGDVRAELERVEKNLPTTERIAPEPITPTRKPFTSKEITVKFQPKKLIIPALAVVAVIAAALGDKEGAVNLLRQATKQGYAFSNIHPTEDFESLADYPPYIQLMKPKG